MTRLANTTFQFKRHDASHGVAGGYGSPALVLKIAMPFHTIGELLE